MQHSYPRPVGVPTGRRRAAHCAAAPTARCARRGADVARLSAAATALNRRAMAVFLALAGLGAPAVAQAQGRPPPDWAIHPPADTEAAIWGIGEGLDQEGARRAALRAIAARLRSTVSGRVTDQVAVIDGTVRRQSAQAVSEEVLKTEFAGAEVVRSGAGGSGVFLLMKVDRPVFIRDTQSRLAVLSKPVAEVEAALPALATLEQFVALKRVAGQTEQALVLAQLLQGAGLEDEGRRSAARFAALLERSKEVASRLVFAVRTGLPDADLAAAVGAHLTQHGMRAASAHADENASGAGVNIITVAAQERRTELFGDRLVKLAVRVSVLDAQGRSVAQRQYETSGSSRLDHTAAREAAVRKLQVQMQAAGAVGAFGLGP